MPELSLSEASVQVPDGWELVTAVSVLWVCPHCHKLVLGEDGDEAPFCIGPKRDPHDETMVGFKLQEEHLRVRTFLASIATAQSQGTHEQTDWMIATAKEGLDG